MAIRLISMLAVATASAALVAPAARAAPPANDNRADAAPVPTFPTTMQGTLADATVERLDPQVSDCGQIDATVWYRVDQAPDGAIVVGVQGALATVIRVYRATGSALKEIDCAAAATGQRAQVSFGSVRGATFYVIVGRKPQTTGTEFALDAKLFLPPANDSWKNAQQIGKLPWRVSGSTLGATQDATDPESCSLAGGTIWYSTTPKADGRIAFRLTAAGDFDAVLAVQQRSRSERRPLGCVRTDKSGHASLPIDVEKGATYLIAVGNLEGSPPGDFALDALAAQAPERAPGSPLVAAGVKSSVNGLTDVNDLWWRTLQPGTTYRISFHANGCPTLILWSLRVPGEPIGSMACNTYRTFTPGPDGGGKYIFEVRAPRSLATETYALNVAAAGEDDIGLGIALPNLATLHGSLSPTGVDVLDRYHFDVATSSDVRIDLRYGPPRRFAMVLVTDDGRRVGSADTQIQRTLAPGRYVLAVGGVPGSPSGRYAVTLVIRQLTATRVGASATEVARGSSMQLSASTAPAPDGGVVEVQVDRFDPLGGWVFSKIVKLRAPGGSITWTPPAIGRWRLQASYAGNLHFAHSTSSYVYVVVK